MVSDGNGNFRLTENSNIKVFKRDVHVRLIITIVYQENYFRYESLLNFNNIFGNNYLTMGIMLI